jgi:hypothetical protein
MAAILARGVHGSGDSNAFCNQECADYYTIRAIDSVRRRSGRACSRTAAAKDGTIQHNLGPCIADPQGDRTATPSTTGAVEVDLSVVEGYQQSDRTGRGLHDHDDGDAAWKGEFSGGSHALPTSRASSPSQAPSSRRRTTDVDETCPERSPSPRHRTTTSSSRVPGAARHRGSRVLSAGWLNPALRVVASRPENRPRNLIRFAPAESVMEARRHASPWKTSVCRSRGAAHERQVHRLYDTAGPGDQPTAERLEA